MTSTDRNIMDAEIIYGAIKRERFWKIGFVGMGLVTALAVGASALVLVSFKPPAPIVVPFDPNTGLAVPNASVETIKLDEERAVIQSLTYRYVIDRETYNQNDNDLRIDRALKRTKGTARKGLIDLWNSGSEAFLPAKYGAKTQIDVVVTSVSLLENDRAQVRMRKTLKSPDGSVEGNFTAIIGYTFNPTQESSLTALWQNPLGFEVHEYALYQDRGQQ